MSTATNDQSDNHSNSEKKHAHHDSGEKIVHEYDGILEADNELPKWWLATFYGAIFVAAVYWLHYEVFKTGWNPNALHQYELEVAAKNEAEKLKTLGAISADVLIGMSKNSSTVAAGKETFQNNCKSCHGDNGVGGIGPNLTDNHWIYGGAPEKIYATVRDGQAQKGMPPWIGSLGEEKVRQVTAYVLTIKGTNVAGGKAPQGTQEN